MLSCIWETCALEMFEELSSTSVLGSVDALASSCCSVGWRSWGIIWLLNFLVNEYF
jgi:hypothetical protein